MLQLSPGSHWPSHLKRDDICQPAWHTHHPVPCTLGPLLHLLRVRAALCTLASCSGYRLLLPVLQSEPLPQHSVQHLLLSSRMVFKVMVSMLLPGGFPTSCSWLSPQPLLLQPLLPLKTIWFQATTAPSKDICWNSSPYSIFLEYAH